MKYVDKLLPASIMSVLLVAFTPVMGAQEVDLHDFVMDSVDGFQPVSGLWMDSQGNLFGTTLFGGSLSLGGTVFELSPTNEGGWTEKVIHNFNGSGGGTDGYRPYSGLISDGKGNLYGTTSTGGTRFTAGGSPIPYGTVFELSPADDGTWTESILYSFGASATDGATPMGSLVFDAQGNLYGTTQQGGANGHGSVFELTPSGGGSWTEKVIYSFGATSTDGSQPLAGLVIDSAGNLYGTTILGGSYSNGYTSGGTVFELTPAGDGSWTETILHSFNTPPSDGSLPVANLLRDSKGNLYGTTESGGAAAAGTVFELSPAGGGVWSENVFNLYTSSISGYTPEAGLTMDAVGNLYGTTSAGGAYARTNVPGGTVFELIPKSDGTWTEETLHNFSETGTDGNTVYGGVIFDAKGNLYGTTEHGGAHAIGTVYELQSAAIPEFSPVPGTYTTTQEVTLSDATPGATVYYTVDGSTPSSNSSEYSTPIKVTSTETIHAIAVAADYITSPVASATYTINPTPNPTLSPTSLTFPATAVGSTSAAQTVTFTNPGTTALAVSSFTFTGTNATEFLIAGKTCGSSLAAGASCTLSLAFKPTATGAASATFNAKDNASNSPQTVALSGTTPSGAPTATLTPAALTFPATAVGSTSTTQTVTFTNTGASSMTVSSFTFTGANASEFLISGKNCGSSLAAGASCELLLAFKPTATGAATATFNAKDNASNSPQTVALSGTTPSGAPTATLTPAALTFPATAVGSTSATQTVTFTNTGTSAMTVSSFSFTGTNAAEFLISGKNCGSSLAAGASCTLLVAFKPTATGAASATFQANDNATNAPQSVSLSGTGH